MEKGGWEIGIGNRRWKCGSFVVVVNKVSDLNLSVVYVKLKYNPVRLYSKQAMLIYKSVKLTKFRCHQTIRMWHINISVEVRHSADMRQ